MGVYLHEIVDTVSARTIEYLDSIAEHHGTKSTAAGDSNAMVGLWSIVEPHGRAPRAVNLWEWRTWERAAEKLSGQFDPEAQDPRLKKWWLGNVALRTGGTDRLLESTSYTRDVAELRASGIVGGMFLQEIVSIHPGRVDDYLTAYGDEGLSAARTNGGELVGAYRVRLRRDQAIIMLAFPGPADLSRYQEAWYSDGALGKWRRREDEFVTGKASSILKPRYFLSSPWHP